MTETDNDRDIGRLEGCIESIESRMDKLEAKIDLLLAAMNMGKGAGFALAKLGGVMLLALGAFGWVYEHIGSAFHK